MLYCPNNRCMAKWEQSNIEGGWDAQHAPVSSTQDFMANYEAKKAATRKKEFGLGHELAAGNQPMFMTGNEVKTHYAPLTGDRKYVLNNPKKPMGDYHQENDSEFWGRKLKESKEGRKKIEESGREGLAGSKVQPTKIKTSLATHVKKNGFPGFVSVETGFHPKDYRTPEILGGHHRIALAAAQFPDHFLAVKHFDSFGSASKDPHYR